MDAAQKRQPPWYLTLAMVLMIGVLIILFSISLTSPSSQIGFLASRIARAQQRLEKIEGEQTELKDSYASAQQELQEIQQLFLQRVREGAPVPIDASFVKLVDPTLIEQLEQAYRPLLDSPNPYHRMAAAKSLIMLTKDRPQQLLAVMPRILEILVESKVNNIDSSSDMDYSSFQAERIDAAVVELRKYLDSGETAVRVAAADLLLSVSTFDPARRDQFRSQVLDVLRPIVEQEQDDYLALCSVNTVLRLRPNADEWIPLLRKRIDQTAGSYRITLAGCILQLDPHDQPAIQVLVDAIVAEINGWEFARLQFRSSEAKPELRLVIEQTLKTQKMSDAKREYLRRILDQEGS